MTPSEVVHSVIERNIDSNQEKPQGFSKLILENKFIYYVDSNESYCLRLLYRFSKYL